MKNFLDRIKNFFKSGNWVIALSVFLMAGIIATLIGLNIYLQNNTGWNGLMYDLMGDLLSAVLISLLIGLITKIVSMKLFTVQINMKKMRDLGIEGIGSGRFEHSDEKKMFGGARYKNKFPAEIKLMFLVGDVFLKEYKGRIIECMNHGCEVQLLIAEPTEKNSEYLKRVADRYNRGKSDYVKLIKDDTLNTAIQIKDASNNPENLKIRFYRDEYQNNLRIATYCKADGKKEITHYWLNVQPLSKAAKDLSIALKGTVKRDERKASNIKDDENLCTTSEQGFDFLWGLYGKTEVVTIDQIDEIRGIKTQA